MQKKIELVCIAGLYVLVLGVMAASSGASEELIKIHVGKNVQVSAAFRDTPQYETLLAADPSNPQRFMACSMYEITHPKGPLYGAYGTVVYISNDGGSTWKSTLKVTNGGVGAGDPACAFGKNEGAYFAELGEAKGSDGKYHGQTIIYASNDGGESWGRPFVARQSDREYVTVDTTGGKYDGRVYVNGAMSVPLLDNNAYGDSRNDLGVLVSSNHGRSFQLMALLSPLDNHFTFAQGNAVVLPSGTYVVAYSDALLNVKPFIPGEDPFLLKVVSSSNGGFSFTKAVTIARFIHRRMPSVNAGLGTTSISPSIAVDTSKGAFNNRLYVAWAGFTNGRSQIFLAHSSDQGKTWSRPVTVSDDVARGQGEGPDDSEPVVAVNRYGVVGISWMDRRNSSDNLGYYERFTASLDGGETFLPSVRVATSPAAFFLGPHLAIDGTSTGGGSIWIHNQPLQAILGYNSRFGFIGGDTEGLVADSRGVFHALWVDNRTGIPQSWTAPILVDGRGVLHGSPELARERDITKDVIFLFTNVRFDRMNGNVSADAYLVNTSRSVIHGPVQTRLMQLTSEIGAPTLIVGSTNGEQGQGAIIDFSTALRDGKLIPNQRTNAVHLVFHLSKLHPDSTSVSTYASALQHFITFTARVFAR